MKGSSTTTSNNLNTWELELIHKLKILNFVSFFNILLSLILFNIIEFKIFNIHFPFVFSIILLSFILNRKGHYLLSTYLFFINGIYVNVILSIFMGLESNVLMHFFPLVLAVVQIFGRKELFIHMVIWCVLFFFSVVTLAFSVPGRSLWITEFQFDVFKVINALVAFFCSIILIAIITWQNIQKETVIRKSYEERKLLLSELFHRVKNNLNIVNSLINLKKESSTSPEVLAALEDCRTRIYSMALVHQQMYSGSEVQNMHIKSYLLELIRNVEHAFGGGADVNLEIETEELLLPISKTVPIGLILNELITNSYKHAQIAGQKLEIGIQVKEQHAALYIELTDNGPGIKDEQLKQSNSLGFELIRSLCEQIDASLRISNQSEASSGANIQIKIVDYSVINQVLE